MKGHILNKAQQIRVFVEKRHKQFSFSKTLTRYQFDTVVSLGLGSPSRSLTSLEQLAVQTALRAEFSISRCVCFDPIFNGDDLEAIANLNWLVDSKFEKYTTGICLFFMPHCDKEIYLDVIKRRINCLDQTVIVGNSFLLYEEQSLGEELIFWRNLNACINISAFVINPEPDHNSLSDTKLIRFKPDCIDRVSELVRIKQSSCLINNVTNEQN